MSRAVTGCAGQGDVPGKVTYKGKTLVWGTVQLEGSDGKIAQGNIEQDGSYSVRGVAIGQARVAVNSPDPKSITLVVKRGKAPQPYPDVPGWFPGRILPLSRLSNSVSMVN